MRGIKRGDRVRVHHDCTFHGSIGTHDAAITITGVTKVTLGVRLSGVRCDGTRIEWIADGTEQVTPRDV